MHEDVEAELVDVSSPVDLSPDVDGGRGVADRFSLTVSASGAVSASLTLPLSLAFSTS